MRTLLVVLIAFLNCAVSSFVEAQCESSFQTIQTIRERLESEITSTKQAVLKSVGADSLPSPFMEVSSVRDTGILIDSLNRAEPNYVELRKQAVALYQNQKDWSLKSYLRLRKRVLNSIGQRIGSNRLVATAQIESLKQLALILNMTPMPAPKDSSESEKSQNSDADKEKQPPKKNQAQQNKPNKQDMLRPPGEQEMDVTMGDIKGGGGSTPFYQFASTVKPVDPKGRGIPFFRLSVFDSWDQSGRLSAVLPYESGLSTRGSLGANSSKKPDGYLTIENPNGRTSMTFPYPYGFRPGGSNLTGYSIEANNGDAFTLTFDSGTVGPQQVTVPLVKNDPHQHYSYTQTDLSVLTQKSGLAESTWPPELVLLIRQLKSESANTFEAARALQKYIRASGEFIYSSSDKLGQSEFDQIQGAMIADLMAGTPKVIALARHKMFKCDEASLLGATLLRDFLGLPTRITEVFNVAGTLLRNQKTEWVVDSNQPSHAVVEVLYSGQWHVLDFTPIKNSPDSGQDSDKEITPFEPNSEDRQDQDPSDQEEQQNQGDGSSESNDQSQPDDTARPEDGTEQKDGGDGEQDTDLTDQQTTDETNAPSEADDREAISQNRLDQILPALSQSINQDAGQASFEPIIERLRASWILDQFIERVQPGEWTAVVQQAGGHSGLLSEAFSFFQRKPWSAKEYMKAHYETASSQILTDPKKTYELLSFLEGYYQLVAKLRDLSANEGRFLESLRQLVSRLFQLRSETSHIQGLVSDVVRELPGTIFREVLNERYDGDILQPNSESQLAFYSDLVEGREKLAMRMPKALRAINLLEAFEVQHRTARSPLISPIPKPKSRDVVIADLPDLGRLSQWILSPSGNPNPVRGLIEKVTRGEQLMIGNRQMTRVVDPRSRIERKMHIIFLDVSPSMKGPRIEALMASTMAFIDQQMSIVDALGNPTSEIWIYKFGTELFPWSDGKLQKVIKTRDDAKELFLSWSNTPIVTENTGTDIQGCILEFIRAVKARYATRDEKVFPLDVANLVLFSDGGSDVSSAEVATAFDSLPADIKIGFAFIAISETNSALEKLAEDSEKEKLGPSKKLASYKRITDADITEILTVRPKAEEDKRVFFESGTSLPAGLVEQLRSTRFPAVPSQIDNQHIAQLQARLNAPTTQNHELFTVEHQLSLKRISRVYEKVSQNQEMSSELKERISIYLLGFYFKLIGNRPICHAEQLILKQLLGSRV